MHCPQQRGVFSVSAELSAPLLCYSISIPLFSCALLRRAKWALYECMIQCSKVERAFLCFSLSAPSYMRVHRFGEQSGPFTSAELSAQEGERWTLKKGQTFRLLKRTSADRCVIMGGFRVHFM